MSTAPTELAADYANPVGHIRPLNGVNLGPLALQGSLDLSSAHRELGFPFVRLHDTPHHLINTVDISNVFPIFHADEDDPANYVFAPTDDYIQSILDCGSQVVYRLGQTIEHQKRQKYFIHPPPDAAKWARICAAIVRHYNEGWAGGFRHGIRHWEIWGEPEIPALWSGTPEQYFHLYETTARHLKAHDPTLRVGGPSSAWWGDFSRAFLTFCRDRDVPLDFFSWHSYMSPGRACRNAVEVRAFLDGLGLGHVESHLNEWNRCFDGFAFGADFTRQAPPLFARIAGAEGAAFAAAMLCLLQDLPVDMANYYHASTSCWGLFDAYGAPAKPFFAFKAFRLMLDGTPRRARVTGNDPEQGIALLAGLSDDGRSAGVLVANAQGPTATLREGRAYIRITLAGLPWPAQARVHRIDAVHSLSPAEILRVTDQPFDLELPAPSAAWLELHPAKS